MGFKDWFKKTINSEEAINLEEFSKDKFANDKWIEHYFKIGFEKPSGESEEAFNLRINQIRHKIISIIANLLMMSRQFNVKYLHHQDNDSMAYFNNGSSSSLATDYEGKLKKSVTIKVIEETKGHYEFLIRFVDVKKQEETITKNISEPILFDNKALAHKKIDYLFSPLQSLIMIDIAQRIEDTLCSILKIKPEQNKTWLKFDGKEPIVEQLDGIQYHSYQLAKRIELYKKYPEIDKRLFGWDFKEFLDWVMEKKNANEHMNKYCKAVEKRLKEQEIEY